MLSDSRMTTFSAPDADPFTTPKVDSDFLESMGDGYLQLDSDWRITAMNRRAEPIVGRSREELLSRNIWEEFPNAVGSVYWTRYHDAVSNCAPAEFDAFFPSLNAWFAVRAYPTAAHGLAVFFTDITDVRRAADEVAEGERRASFMAHATSMLFASMDYDRTLADLARIAVPTIGDWCAVDILEQDNSLRRLAVAHQDPAKIDLAKQLEERYPEDPSIPTSRLNVLKSGLPAFFPDITPEMIDQGARDAEHARLIHVLGLTSFITVPLIAREHRLGTITIVMAESGRRYTPRDVELAQDLANRAAIAVDNARVHREAVEGRALLEEQALELELQAMQLQDSMSELETANEAMHESATELELQTEALQRANDALTEGEARYRFLADTIPVQVWTADTSGALDYVSKDVAEYFARSAEQIIGEGWLAVLHPEDIERTIARWTHSLTTGEPYEVEFRLWSPAHQEHRWHLGRAIPLRDDDGTIIKWFGSNTDIADQKRVEQERERLQYEAEHANRAKMEFLAAMSHELRTPLNAISGYAELMDMEVVGPVTDGQRDYLARVKRSGKFLLSLINDVLNYAKLDAGALEIKRAPVRLDSILSAAHTLVEPQMRAKELVYNYGGCDTTIIVEGDAEKIEQVVLNLLTNSAKFTEHGGKITLTCLPGDGIAQIRVSDTGRGIPADKLETVFDPFVQVDRNDSRESQKGVGLGLAISRELARRMGGDLTAESTVGEGSTFTLSLPRSLSLSDTTQ